MIDILRKIKTNRIVKRELGSKQIGRALISYTTASLCSRHLAVTYTHTNHWEMLEMVGIFNALGFSVHAVDRDADVTALNLKDEYDVFVGLGASNSGKNYSEIAKRIPSAVKILYVTSQVPTEFNKAILGRYEYLNLRHPGNPLRPIGLKENVDLSPVVELTDYIFCVGNDFTVQGYRQFGKPIYKILLSTYPGLSLSVAELTSRSADEFLYFGGNRNILKGLDLLIDAFSKLPHLKLHVCTRSKEGDFDSFYHDVISRAKNIFCHGFVPVGSKTFSELSKKCAYVVLPSCTEASATSVLTCMRKGIIPVVTKEADIPIEDYGFLLEDIDIVKLSDKFNALSCLPKPELIARALKTYSKSFHYTQGRFTESFTIALLDVIAKTGIARRAKGEL